MPDVDVLIVGAGPTGLTLAIDLARRGITVRIIEQQPLPQPGSRGFTLKPRSLEAFDDLGVAGEIAVAGATQSRTRFHLGTQQLFDLDLPPAPRTPHRPYPNSLAIPQWRTEALLRARLAELGVSVEFGTRLAGFNSDADGVTATVEDNATATPISAGYLIGADGGRSFVRQHLGLAFHGSTDTDIRALIADVHVTGLNPADGVHLWLGTDGHLLALRPTPHEPVWQAVASLEPARDGSWPEPSLCYLQNAVDTRTGRRDITLSDPGWLSVWRYNARMVDTYRMGRVFLAGDAAHVHSPFGGFGMNTGIQDAYNLGWKLALVLHEQADDSLLDTYEIERLPVAAAVLAESDRRFAAAMPPWWVRPLMGFILRKFIAQQQKRDRTDHPRYRQSPLSAGERKGRLHAGDVAPDAIVRHDGQVKRLTDLFRGPHFTALSFGSAGVLNLGGDLVHGYAVAGHRSGGPATLADVGGTVRAAYGVPDGSLVVVRPDGYIGFIARRPHPSALAGYLARIGMRNFQRYAGSYGNVAKDAPAV